MRLDDGLSVAICVPPASPSVAITVRRFGKRSSSAAQLVEQGALPANVLLTRRRSLLRLSEPGGPEAQEPCRVHTTPISLGIPTRRRYGIRP